MESGIIGHLESPYATQMICKHYVNEFIHGLNRSPIQRHSPQFTCFADAVNLHKEYRVGCLGIFRQTRSMCILDAFLPKDFFLPTLQEQVNFTYNMSKT
jgi:hypothetical protein